MRQYSESEINSVICEIVEDGVEHGINVPLHTLRTTVNMLEDYKRLKTEYNALILEPEKVLRNINSTISKRIVTKPIEESQKHEIQNEVNETINDYLYDKDATYCCIALRFEKRNGESKEEMLIVGKSFYEEDGGL